MATTKKCSVNANEPFKNFLKRPGFGVDGGFESPKSGYISRKTLFEEIAAAKYYKVVSPL